MQANNDINLRVAYNGEVYLYELKKETFYAPTVFVDTLFDDSARGYPGIVFVTIEIFKDTTEDQEHGTYGELKAYLDSTASDKRVRVLDLRNNPGGNVKQCVNMADLFVKEGILSIYTSRSMDENGISQKRTDTTKAKAGDPGEQGRYIILANGGSASCSEIFISAVTETTDIPFVGSKTYGKGVGQTFFKTYAGGLAIITDLKFITPNGHSYHLEGIHPKYECGESLGENCAAKVANQIYGVKIPLQDNVLAKRASKLPESTVLDFAGGAIEWVDSDHYFRAFRNSLQ